MTNILDFPWKNNNSPEKQKPTPDTEVKNTVMNILNPNEVSIEHTIKATDLDSDSAISLHSTELHAGIKKWLIEIFWFTPTDRNSLNIVNRYLEYACLYTLQSIAFRYKLWLLKWDGKIQISLSNERKTGIADKIDILDICIKDNGIGNIDTSTFSDPDYLKRKWGSLKSMQDYPLENTTQDSSHWTTRRIAFRIRKL